MSPRIYSKHTENLKYMRTDENENGIAYVLTLGLPFPPSFLHMQMDRYYKKSRKATNNLTVYRIQASSTFNTVVVQ